MLNPLRGFSGMAATLAPLRKVSESEEDDEEEEDDDEPDEIDQFEKKIYFPNGIRPQIIRKSPLVSGLTSCSSSNNSNCSTSTSISKSRNEQKIVVESRDLKSVKNRLSNISENVNAPRLNSMEGLPLSQSRQSDDFGTFTTALLEPPSSHHHDVMSMEMQQMGGYLDPNSFGGSSRGNAGSSSMDYDDFGQSSSMYDMHQDSFDESSKFSSHSNNSTNDMKYEIRYEPQPQPHQQQQQPQQQHQQHHIQSIALQSHQQPSQLSQQQHLHQTHTIQRTFVPAYPVKTVDPLSHYGQGMRNVAHLPPNAAIPKRKSGGARSTAHKKPEPVDPLRVEFEVARNVSQILSATKQQKLAAEAQQKTGVPPAPLPQIRTSFPCPNCNRQMSNARNLQRHRQTCPPTSLNSSMPPPMTPVTPTPSSPAQTPTHFQLQQQQQQQQSSTSVVSATTTTTTMYTVTTSNNSNQQSSSSNYYDFKITDDITYSDWSRSDSYSGPHSVSADPEFTEALAFTEQLRMDPNEKREEINTLDPNPQMSMQMGIDAELGMPLSLDCDEPIAHSSSTSMSSNSQGTPQNYQCESCKKAVSSIRSLKRHHTTCKQYVAEYGISPEESTSTTNPQSIANSTGKTVRKNKVMKRPLLLDEEEAVQEKPPMGGRVLVTKVTGTMTPTRQMLPAVLRIHHTMEPTGKSALIEALKSEGPVKQQIVPNPYQSQSQPQTPQPQFQQPYNYYPQPQPQIQQQQYQIVHNPYPQQQHPQPSTSGLPPITASPWFSSMPNASSSTPSSSVVVAENSSDCDCGGVKCKENCDGLPKSGLAANTCEDCSRQLCSASNLKRHRATCKMAIQRLCGSSSSTSQPTTPQTPSQMSLLQAPPQSAPPQTSTTTSIKPAVILTPQPTTATVTYTKVNGVGGTTAWSAEKALTSPRMKTLAPPQMMQVNNMAPLPPPPQQQQPQQTLTPQSSNIPPLQPPPSMIPAPLSAPLSAPPSNIPPSQPPPPPSSSSSSSSSSMPQPPITPNSINNTSANYVITSEPAASKPWITVGEHLRAQHVQQQRMLEAERTTAYHMQIKPIPMHHQQYPQQHQHHQQHQQQQNQLQQQQHQHQQQQMMNQSHQIQHQQIHHQQMHHQPQQIHHHHQNQQNQQQHQQQQQQQQQKYGIVEHQHNDNVHISSHPILNDSRQSFVSSFSDLGSDDEFDDIDMDAFEEDLNRGIVEMYQPPPKEQPIKTTSEDFTITTMPKTKYPQMLPPQSQVQNQQQQQQQKTKKTIVVKKLDSKIEMTPDHTVSPLDSIITTEPLPGDVILHEKKFDPAPIKNFEPVSIEIQPLQAGGGPPKPKKVQQEYQCPECLKTYSCRKNVKRHRMAVHKLTPDEIARKPAQIAPTSAASSSSATSSSSSTQPVTARRHTVAGTAPTSAELMNTSPNFQFRLQKQQPPLQQNQPQQQPHQTPQSQTQMISPRSDWNSSGPSSASNWSRARSGEYVDEEQSKETARIAAELKRSAEEEMAEIEGKKPRTELAEADTTFTEDNEKTSLASLPPLSTSSSLGLPSLSSPNTDQCIQPPLPPPQQQQIQAPINHHTPKMTAPQLQKQTSVQQMVVAPMQQLQQQPQNQPQPQPQSQMLPPQSQQHNHYPMYQTSSTGMAASLPSIGSWNEYNYNMQPYHQVVPQQPQPQSQTYTVQVVSQVQVQPQASAPQPTQQPSLPQTPVEENPSETSAEKPIVVPKKKKTHTCTGCHKILSSDYSLRRHRSTCLEVKNAQANKAMQMSQRSGGSKKKSSSTTPTQPQDSEGESQHSTSSSSLVPPPTEQQNQTSNCEAEIKMEVDEKVEKKEDIPDSTTSQRHDRSTSPLSRDCLNGNGITTQQPTTVDSKPIVEVKPQMMNPKLENEEDQEKDCGKMYPNEWDFEKHRTEECSDFHPYEPTHEMDELFIIFNGNPNKIRISKSLLTNSSSFFAQNLQNYETSKGHFRVSDCEWSQFRVLLDVSTNKCSITEETIDFIVDLAMKYQFNGLIEPIQQFISDVLPKSSIMHAILLAEKHRFSHIKQHLFNSMSIDVFRSLSADQHYKIMDANLKAELLDKWGTFL